MGQPPMHFQVLYTYPFWVPVSYVQSTCNRMYSVICSIPSLWRTSAVRRAKLQNRSDLRVGTPFSGHTPATDLTNRLQSFQVFHDSHHVPSAAAAASAVASDLATFLRRVSTGSWALSTALAIFCHRSPWCGSAATARDTTSSCCSFVPC